MKSVLLILFVLLAYASDAQVRQLDAQNWLTGTWKQKNGNCETWRFNADRTQLLGTGFKISRNGDTTVLEQMTITEKEGQLYFVADVAHNASAVWFKIVETKPRYFRAENPEHDFPQYVQYALKNETELQAEVGAKSKKIKFSFQKIP